MLQISGKWLSNWYSTFILFLWTLAYINVKNIKKTESMYIYFVEDTAFILVLKHKSWQNLEHGESFYASFSLLCAFSLDWCL